MNVGVLASGNGTNLQALIDRAHGRAGVRVVAVGSDRADAPALERTLREFDGDEFDAGVIRRHAEHFSTAAFRERFSEQVHQALEAGSG